MVTPSAYRPYNLAVTSSSCRKQEEMGKQSFLWQDTEFSALAKRNGNQEKGLYGVGLAVRETVCRKSLYIHQLIDGRHISMHPELAGESVAISLVVAYASTEANPNTQLKYE